MQINLQSPILKESLKYLGWLLLFVLLSFKGCSENTPQPQFTKVTVPEIKGSFKPVKPEQKPILQDSKPLKNDNFGQILSKKENEFLQNQITLLLSENDKLKQSFINAPDSTKIKIYKNCVQLNSFSHTWDNDTIQATSYGIVRGEVQSIALKYTIKERKIEVSQKEMVFRLMGGLEIGNNINLTNPIFRANLGLQNRKGNLLTISYDNNKNIYLGYYFSVFSYKR
jgi:hypothetical protein